MMIENEANILVAKRLVYPAYEQCIKASHLFNLLDARGVLSVSERATFIKKVRNMSNKCCQLYLEKSEEHEK